jgi:diguanylate cyclase (GGDEF)-like protein
MPKEPEVSLTLDRQDQMDALGTRALERMPYPTLILDGDLRLRFANAMARDRLEPPAPEDDPAPPLDAVLNRSGRVSGDLRLRIMSCCAAVVHGRDRHDALLAVAPGQSIAFHGRALGDGRWMVVLEERIAAIDPAAITDEAHRDSVTDLGNRLHMDQKIADALRHEDQEQPPAILIFDIDRFRDINDRMGRQGGDALLRAMAGRLKRATRDADHIARLDADRFGVLQANGQGAEHLAARLIDILSRPYLIRGELATIAVSAGIALAVPGQTPAAMVDSANLARMEAKRAGGNAWRRFGQSLADRARSRQDLEADLRKALSLEQLSLAFQPKVNARTFAITGFEALARWTHPVRGAVPPGLFIPIAEEIGAIGPIGAWALRQACRAATLWPEPLGVSVNVSARQLADGRRLVDDVLESLRDASLPPRRLTLEFAEGALIRRPDEVRTILTELRDLGVRIALDDFGAGDMSLRQLRTFPFDQVSLDQTLIRTLDSAADSGATIRAIATLGAGLGITVVAEGVETRHQAMILRGDGCTEIQGYLFSRPVTEIEVPALLNRDLSRAFAG